MKKTNHKRCDVIISGAGTPGLTLALLLERSGLNIILIDPTPPHVFKSNGLDTGNTGAWDKCSARGGVMEALKIIDDSGLTRAPVEAIFHADDIGQDVFGINMPNNLLRSALAAKVLKSKNIKLLTETKLLSYETDDFGVTVQTSSDDMRAKLLIGADGRNSAVRQNAGIDVWERDYEQSAITCLIEHTRPHNNTSTEFHRPTGPFALVPLPGNISSVVWVDTHDAVDDFMKMNKSNFTRALQDRSKNLLGEITLAHGPQSFPLKALRAKKLCARRVALIAEAAHVLHPLTAQGLNLSLRDVATLADIITEATELGLDIGSHTLLSKYESRRRADVGLRVHGTDTLNRFISHRRMPLHALRRAGLKTVDNFPFLRDFIMQQGMSPKMP